MELQPEEPHAGPWRAVALEELVAELAAGLEAGSTGAATTSSRPRIIAVDGRGAAGKSTLADALAARLPATTVVHTDDLAWHEPMFRWGHLLQDLLEQLHRGEGVRLRPPSWEARGRDGQIEVPATSRYVVLEGTGAAQRGSADLIGAVIWVQSDFAEAERRGIERDVAHGMNGDAEQSAQFWHDWMAHELRFFAEDRPWERADLVVAGTSVELARGTLGTDEVAVAPPPLAVPSPSAAPSPSAVP